MTWDEPVDIVDERDLVTRTGTIGECLEKGLLHRAVAVLVIRSGGKFVLQRRSKSDMWHPGLWTISSTGHVREAESYEVAAHRELKEELGIESKLEVVGKFLLPPIRSEVLTEWEWVTFYVAHTDAKCTIDPVELDAVSEFTPEELRSIIDGSDVTPDAVILLRGYLERGRE